MISPLAKLQPGESGNLSKLTSLATNIEFKNNNLKNIDTRESYRETLRLIVDKKMGTAFVTNPKHRDILLDYARQATRWGNSVNYHLPGPSSLVHPAIRDPQITDRTWQKLLEPAQNFIDRAQKYHKDSQAAVKIKVEENEIGYANTKGINESFPATAISIILSLSLIEGKNMLGDYVWLNHTHLDEINWQDAEERLFTNIDRGRTNVKLPPGSYPVLFTPETAADILNPLQACLNGKAVVRGLSPWQGQLDNQIFHESITITNDGLLDRGIASRPFDNEGIPCQTFPLIEKGYLKNFLLDLETAQELALPSRGTAGNSGPQPNNMIMEPGRQSYKTILENMEEGVLIAATMGAWAGNPYGGQVSGNIYLGYKIEGGKIKGRIKDAMFSVNTFKALLNQVSSISSERRWTGNLLLPFILLEDIYVAVKS